MTTERRPRTRGGLTYDEWCQQGRELYQRAHREHQQRAQGRKRKAAVDSKSNHQARARKKTKKTERARQDLRGILNEVQLRDGEEEEKSSSSSRISAAGANTRNEAQILLDSESEDAFRNCDMTLKAEPWTVFSSKRPLRTFAATRRKSHASDGTDQQQQVVELEIPPSQYWAVIEGVATLHPGEDAGSFLQQLLLEGRSDLLPSTGRVLELLPVESKAGRWIAQIKSNRRLGVQRDRPQDWSDKRLVLRHEDHSAHAFLSTKGRSPEGYSTTVIDPSPQRLMAMHEQDVDLSHPSFVASLAIVAFDGFSNSSESRHNALEIASAVLKSCRENPCWDWIGQRCQEKGLRTVAARVPDLIPVPPFRAILEDHLDPQAAQTIQGAGGVSLLGCLVDDLLQKTSAVDYRIILLRHELSDRVVGVDGMYTTLTNPVFFCSSVYDNNSQSQFPFLSQ
jgi:hypothetical protein